MAEKLTLQQQMAVDDRGGKLLVSAAAGSGKTKVLVDRLMKYILDEADPSNVDEFLLITFTEAAASELRGKIAAKLSQHIAEDPSNKHLQRQMQRLYMAKISTVHAFCADLLREFAYKLDIPGDFRVGDENECLQLRQTALSQALEDAYNRIHEDSDFQLFVDTQGAGRNDGQLEQIILSVYENARCHIDPDAWLRQCLCNADVADLTDAAQTVWGESLMADLKSFLDAQIPSMEKCLQAVSNIPEQEKATAVLSDNVNMLRRYQDSVTWDAVVALKDTDFGTLSFKKKTMDPEIAEYVKAVRDACKEILKAKLSRFYADSEQVLADLRTCTGAARGLISVVNAFDVNYTRLKRARHILDFSDLEQYTLTLLLGKNRNMPTASARDIAKRFRQIMVDEYQDTNEVQDAIYSVLTEEKNNLFMVGDVKQSIYQFRLADPGIFLKKYTQYQPAESAVHGQGRKVLLSSNFRSGGSVLQAVNDVFSLCMSQQVGGLQYGQEESLVEGIPHDSLGEPEVELHGIITEESTYEEEAEFVAQRICQLLDGSHMVRCSEGARPIVPEDIVILLRSPGTTGSYFQYALESRGIPCNCGGSADLLTMPEVEVLHALLMVISNPRQDIPLVTVLASPLFGFSADDLASIRGKNRNCCLYDAMCVSEQDKCESFLQMLTSLRRKASMESLPELLNHIFHITRIDALYTLRENGEAAGSNLLAFYHYAVRYAKQNGRNLDRFLSHLEILRQKGLSVDRESGSGCVRVMSIHKSKGLEFPVVFLSGLSKAFNRMDLNGCVLCHKDLGLGLSCVDMQTRVRYPALSKHAIAVHTIKESLSEELRILYVAMTRARDRLIMTYADRYLENTLRKLSARSVFSSDVLLSSDVKNAGEWVLRAALQRTEAGTLFAVAGNAGFASVRECPWLITLSRSVVADADETEELEDSFSDADSMDRMHADRIRQIATFQYPFLQATQAPSKQTATQRKGREKDQEISQNAPEQKVIRRIWRKTTEKENQIRGKEFGNAVHNVLRYIQYSVCTSVEKISKELARLQEQGYISSAHAKMIDPEMIYQLFSTETGKKLVASSNVLKEYKFSILDDATHYDETLQGEQILLQGVVDCALIEDDGITIIDFKTDYATDDTVDQLSRQYALQVQTYADAMSRIFSLPIKGKALYFFRLNRFCWIV